VELAAWERLAGPYLTAAGIRHFSPREIAPVGRLAHGNTGPALLAPGPEELAGAVRLARLLERVRARVGKPIWVTSWYRDPEYNRAVGGAPESLHTTGTAADVKVAGVSPREVARLVYEDAEAALTGVGVYPTFTHVDLRGTLGRAAPARW
jgi:zinc D-Ala-D-Ala carboxypeptidase